MGWLNQAGLTSRTFSTQTGCTCDGLTGWQQHTQSGSIWFNSCCSCSERFSSEGTQCRGCLWLLKGGLPTQECLGFCLTIQTDHVCNEVNWIAESCWPFSSCHLWNGCFRHIEGLRTGREFCCFFFFPLFLWLVVKNCAAGSAYEQCVRPRNQKETKLAIMMCSWMTLLSVWLYQTI